MLVAMFSLVALLYAIVLAESLVVLFKKKPIDDNNILALPESNQKNISAIVCALLPNENDVLLKTVSALLDELSFNDENEVIVSVVSRETSNIIFELRKLAAQQRQLTLIEKKWSSGKYEQLNEAISKSANELIYILDADERPNHGMLESCALSYDGSSIHQGVTLPRNTNTALGKIVAIETAAKYLIALQYRDDNGGGVYFCGSNAIWPKSCISQIGFTNSALVEDVEASVRARYAGIKFTLNSAMNATELAPTSLRAWWIQRRRWAKGWLDVGREHGGRIIKSKEFGLRERFDWIYLIYIRRVALSALMATLLLCSLWTLGISDLYPAANHLIYIGWMCIFLLQIAVSVAQAITVSKIANGRFKVRDFFVFCASFPTYEALKSLVAVDATVKFLFNKLEWQVTPRSCEKHG